MVSWFCRFGIRFGKVNKHYWFHLCSVVYFLLIIDCSSRCSKSLVGLRSLGSRFVIIHELVWVGFEFGTQGQCNIEYGLVWARLEATTHWLKRAGFEVGIGGGSAKQALWIYMTDCPHNGCFERSQWMTEERWTGRDERRLSRKETYLDHIEAADYHALWEN